MEEKDLTANELVPAGSLWIKVGIDKGGEYNKLSFQPVNLTTHNSVKNTYTFGMYEGNETFAEMDAAFKSFDVRIGQLQRDGLMLQGTVYKLEFFLCADVKALQTMLGLSQGVKFFCPFARPPRNAWSIGTTTQSKEHPAPFRNYWR